MLLLLMLFLLLFLKIAAERADDDDEENSDREAYSEGFERKIDNLLGKYRHSSFQ